MKVVRITVTDLSGGLIKSRSYSECRLINLTIEKPVGVYLLIVESDSKSAVLKLVKK